MRGRAGGSEKFAELRATLSPVGSERQFAILCHLIIAASTRNAQLAAPNANCQLASSLNQRCAEDSARYGRIETGIDNQCRSGLIRQRIPMSTAPLVCQICKESKSPHSGMIAELIRPSLLEFIKRKMPDIDSKAFICFEDLGEFRKDYVKEVLEDEIGELSALDQEVVESLEQHEILSSDIIKQFERKLTFGERLSDRIAEFGGSWKFLITFGAVILIWIAINGIMLATRAFDPFPFILLNLVLSCLAAVQAPVIMMSQNRSEARDRLRAENDYKVNLKAELEIRHLHEKLDHLLRRQYNRLFEIQQIQIELLQEIGRPKR